MQRWPAEIGMGESERSKFRSLSRAARFTNLESENMADDPPLPDWAKKVAEEQDWFIPSSDESPQNDDAATTLRVARKLMGDIHSLLLIDGVKLTGAVHAEVVRMFVKSFNTNLRELGQLLDRHGDQLAEQYQPKGAEIGKWFGRTFAELAGKIGQSVRLALLLFTDPTKAASAIGEGSKFVAVDPDAVVNKWQMIRKRLEKSFDQADLQRLNVALENEGERVALLPMPPAAPLIGATPFDEVAETVKRVKLLIGSDGDKLMAIVNHPTYTTDQKLRALDKLDERFKGYKSKDLAELLGVSESSIRNGDVWREWNPKPIKRAKSARK